jgi:hypothetical protein
MAACPVVVPKCNFFVPFRAMEVDTDTTAGNDAAIA